MSYAAGGIQLFTFNSLPLQRIKKTEAVYVGVVDFTIKRLNTLIKNKEINKNSFKASEINDYIVKNAVTLLRSGTFALFSSSMTHEQVPVGLRWTYKIFLSDCDSQHIEIELSGLKRNANFTIDEVPFEVIKVTIKIKSLKNASLEDEFRNLNMNVSEEKEPKHRGIIYENDLCRGEYQPDVYKLFYEGEMHNESFEAVGRGFLFVIGTHFRSYSVGDFTRLKTGMLTTYYNYPYKLDSNHLLPTREEGRFILPPTDPFYIPAFSRKKSIIERGSRSFAGTAKYEGYFCGDFFFAGTYTDLQDHEYRGSWSKVSVSTSLGYGSELVFFPEDTLFSQTQTLSTLIFYLEDEKISAMYSGTATFEKYQMKYGKLSTTDRPEFKFLVKCDGKGILFEANGQIIYDGIWKQGDMQGGKATFRELVYDEELNDHRSESLKRSRVFSTSTVYWITLGLSSKSKSPRLSDDNNHRKS